MNGTTPPMTISIQDCMKHMAEGGKNDASYVADLFEEKVLEYDPLKICTIVFYFDGTLNVQKAGEVLMARFPHTFCFHGGEHDVILLFFSFIVKSKPIKVYPILATFYYTSNQLTHPTLFCLSRFWFSKHAVFIMCSDPVWIAPFMPNSWHCLSPLPPKTKTAPKKAFISCPSHWYLRPPWQPHPCPPRQGEVRTQDRIALSDGAEEDQTHTQGQRERDNITYDALPKTSNFPVSNGYVSFTACTFQYLRSLIK